MMGDTYQKVFMEQALVKATVPSLLIQDAQRIAALLHALVWGALATNGALALRVYDARGERPRYRVGACSHQRLGVELGDERAQTFLGFLATQGRGGVVGWNWY